MKCTGAVRFWRNAPDFAQSGAVVNFGATGERAKGRLRKTQWAALLRGTRAADGRRTGRSNPCMLLLSPTRPAVLRRLCGVPSGDGFCGSCPKPKKSAGRSVDWFFGPASPSKQGFFLRAHAGVMNGGEGLLACGAGKFVAFARLPRGSRSGPAFCPCSAILTRVLRFAQGSRIESWQPLRHRTPGGRSTHKTQKEP